LIGHKNNNLSLKHSFDWRSGLNARNYLHRLSPINPNKPEVTFCGQMNYPVFSRSCLMPLA
jgi:hypothetical protein